MKNIAVLLSLIASFAIFTGCASKSAYDQNVAAPAAPVHHIDYKGETK